MSSLRKFYAQDEETIVSEREGQLDNKADELLWEWAVKQEEGALDQFATGIVGIGTLFFAYGGVNPQSIRLIVASIGC